MRHGSLFSGIGGFDLAAEWAGWENVFHCEWNEFGRKVLGYYWPEAESFGDITKSDFSKYEGTVDIISGGFPCQPYSLAGKRKGKGDDRHLWPEMLRVIKQVKPTWVVGENVYGLVNWSGGMVFHEIISDLENAGYEVQPYLIPAVGVDAPHRRDRLWIVAHSVNARTGDRLRGNGNGEKENEGWVGQSQLKFREDGKDDVAHTVTGLCGGGRTVGQGGNDGKRGIYPSETEQAGNDLWSETERCHADDGEKGTISDTKSTGLEGGIRSGEPVRLDARSEENASDTSCNGSNRTQESENSGGQSGEWGRCNIDNSGEVRQGNGNEDASDTGNQGLQGFKNNGNIGKVRENGDKQFARFFQPTFDQFPTQPPVRTRNDGFSRPLVRYVTKELRDEISNTSKENRIKNLSEVWERISQEEIWDKVRRFYSLESAEVLFQTMQLYQTGNFGQNELSPFSEKISEPVLSKLRKHGEFRHSPQGQELEKQRSKQLGDIVSYLPHEIPLAARAFESAMAKFDAWHRIESIKAYGNAVVPQVVYQIFKAINEYDSQK